LSSISTTSTVSSSSTCQSVAPTYTPPGTTPDCCEFYIIEPMNDCATVEEKFGLTLQEFRDLNTAVDSTCSNLLLGIAFVF
jgi:hypothetical protein